MKFEISGKKLFDFTLQIHSYIRKSYDLIDKASFDIISKSKSAFKEASLFALEKAAQVGIIRISQLEVYN